jgi:hypothetical protein
VSKGPDVVECHAKAKSSGKKCKQPVVPGATVCVYHGGSAPQVQEAAKRRLLAMADPALAALNDIVQDKGKTRASVRLAAARDILDRIGLGATHKTEVNANITITDDEFTAALTEWALDPEKIAEYQREKDAAQAEAGS